MASGIGGRNGLALRRVGREGGVIVAWDEANPSVSDPDEPTRGFSGLAAFLVEQEVSVARQARYRDLPADARSTAGRVLAPLVMAPQRALARGSSRPTCPGASRSARGAGKSSGPSSHRRGSRPVVAGRLRRRIAFTALLLALVLATTLIARVAAGGGLSPL
jgi:hypothetical protein